MHRHCTCQHACLDCSLSGCGKCKSLHAPHPSHATPLSIKVCSPHSPLVNSSLTVGHFAVEAGLAGWLD
jgi:hypothetical protein